MASGDVSKVLRAPGRLVVNPSNLAAAYPYGGVEVGKTKPFWALAVPSEYTIYMRELLQDKSVQQYGGVIRTQEAGDKKIELGKGTSGTQGFGDLWYGGDKSIGGDANFEPSNVDFSSDLSLDDYDVYRGDIPAGPRGLDELRRQGKIRRATQGECDAWMEGARRRNPDMYTRLYPTSTYVVLEEITLPPGLFGAHSAAFIIPAGAPRPDGPKGHCQFCYMEDFTRE